MKEYCYLELTDGFELLTAIEWQNRISEFYNSINFAFKMRSAVFREKNIEERIDGLDNIKLQNSENKDIFIYFEKLKSIVAPMPKVITEKIIYFRVEKQNGKTLKELLNKIGVVHYVQNNNIDDIKRLFDDIIPNDVREEFSLYVCIDKEKYRITKYNNPFDEDEEGILEKYLSVNQLRFYANVMNYKCEQVDCEED
ncbi:TPA: hypothetical protein N2D99_002028 [Clostridium botulinum]|nr:hypothetical protein [Clostridium botulinum]